MVARPIRPFRTAKPAAVKKAQTHARSEKTQARRVSEERHSQKFRERRTRRNGRCATRERRIGRCMVFPNSEAYAFKPVGRVWETGSGRASYIRRERKSFLASCVHFILPGYLRCPGVSNSYCIITRRASTLGITSGSEQVQRASGQMASDFVHSMVAGSLLPN